MDEEIKREFEETFTMLGYNMSMVEDSYKDADTRRAFHTFSMGFGAGVIYAANQVVGEPS